MPKGKGRKGAKLSPIGPGAWGGMIRPKKGGSKMVGGIEKSVEKALREKGQPMPKRLGKQAPIITHDQDLKAKFS